MRADVLVVDDDLDIRLTLVELLREEGYAVAELGDGELLAETLAETEPVLVLLDLTMPRFDAPRTLASLRQDGWLERCTFLALSGLENAPEYARRLGMHGSIGKPFDVEELLSRVEQLCRVRELRAPENQPHA